MRPLVAHTKEFGPAEPIVTAVTNSCKCLLEAIAQNTRCNVSVLCREQLS